MLLGGFNIHECGVSCLGMGEEEFLYLIALLCLVVQMLLIVGLVQTKRT